MYKISIILGSCLQFYGMIILVKTKPLCRGMACLPFQKSTNVIPDTRVQIFSLCSKLEKNAQINHKMDPCSGIWIMLNYPTFVNHTSFLVCNIVANCKKSLPGWVQKCAPKYSQGSNSEHSNSESIRIPNVFMFCIRMVRILNVQNHSYERNIRKPNFSGSLGRFI